MTRKSDYYENYTYDDDDRYGEYKKNKRRFSPKLEEKRYTKKSWQDEMEDYYGDDREDERR